MHTRGLNVRAFTPHVRMVTPHVRMFTPYVRMLVHGSSQIFGGHTLSSQLKSKIS